MWVLFEVRILGATLSGVEHQIVSFEVDPNWGELRSTFGIDGCYVGDHRASYKSPRFVAELCSHGCSPRLYQANARLRRELSNPGIRLGSTRVQHSRSVRGPASQSSSRF